MSTDGNSFFLICQTISGPRMLPNGITKPASALKWQSMFHMRAWLSGLDDGGGDEPAGVAGGGGLMGGGYAFLNSPKIGLFENGFHTQFGYRVRTWVSL